MAVFFGEELFLLVEKNGEGDEVESGIRGDTHRIRFLRQVDGDRGPEQVMETVEGRTHAQGWRGSCFFGAEQVAPVAQAVLQDAQPDGQVPVGAEGNPAGFSLRENQEGSVGKIVWSGFAEVGVADVVDKG